MAFTDTALRNLKAADKSYEKSDGGYEQDSGLVFLRFSQDVVPLITRLEVNFTSYEIQQISSLTSAYAI